MEMNASVNEENENISSKKVWLKPECEVIGKDRVKSGIVPSYTEAAKTVSGYLGVSS